MASDDAITEMAMLTTQVGIAEQLVCEQRTSGDPEVHARARRALAEVIRHAGRTSAALAGADHRAVAAEQSAHRTQHDPPRRTGWWRALHRRLLTRHRGYPTHRREETPDA